MSASNLWGKRSLKPRTGPAIFLRDLYSLESGAAGKPARQKLLRRRPKQLTCQAPRLFAGRTRRASTVTGRVPTVPAFEGATKVNRQLWKHTCTNLTSGRSSPFDLLFEGARWLCDTIRHFLIEVALHHLRLFDIAVQIPGKPARHDRPSPIAEIR